MKLSPLEWVQGLVDRYPQTPSFLNYRNPFELLIAVILSAQCTDAKVNEITPRLFQFYPRPLEMSQAPIEVLERLVFSTGFYRDKAAHIQGASRILVDRFDGQVPEALGDLLSLPGVGRKTAAVIRGKIFGHPAIIVDTHFKRVVRRLELTEESAPDKIEASLSAWVPEALQYKFSMAANAHGRDLCHARNPNCMACPFRQPCPSSVI